MNRLTSGTLPYIALPIACPEVGRSTSSTRPPATSVSAARGRPREYIPQIQKKSRGRKLNRGDVMTITNILREGIAFHKTLLVSCE